MKKRHFFIFHQQIKFFIDKYIYTIIYLSILKHFVVYSFCYSFSFILSCWSPAHSLLFISANYFQEERTRGREKVLIVGVVIEIVCWLSSIVSIKRKAIWRQGWGLRDHGGGGGGGVVIHCEHCDQLPNIKQKLFLLHFPITIQYKFIVDCDSFRLVSAVVSSFTNLTFQSWFLSWFDGFAAESYLHYFCRFSLLFISICNRKNGASTVRK